MTRFL